MRSTERWRALLRRRQRSTDVVEILIEQVTLSLAGTTPQKKSKAKKKAA